MSTEGQSSTDQPKAPQQAQWNVQVVKGKVTTRCLWNACKALGLGLVLLTIGTAMAVVGYYADQLSIRSEVRGNSTVRIKNESRGFHLNNLSYAGPIVMGIGGFIVVAACVMTFEARDSAAKVVPARFKPNLNSSVHGGSTKSTPRSSRPFQRMESKRNTSSQTGRSSGLYKLETSLSGSDWSPKNDPSGRRALTAAFVKQSREMMGHTCSVEHGRRWRGKMSEVNLNKSPSAPDLITDEITPESLKREMARNINRRLLTKASPKAGSRLQRESVRPLEGISSNLLLRPNYLERQAVSMDNPFYESIDIYTPPSTRLSRQPSRRSRGSRESIDLELGSSAGISGSQASMALDLHDCQVTIKVKDETVSKRSDTARRHQLLRQRPVEEYKEPSPPRSCCQSRYPCTFGGEDCCVKTKSSLSLKGSCPQCPRVACGRNNIPKMTADLRSKSFSQTCTYGESRKCCCYYDEGSKIYCIEDQKRKTNLSSDNIRVSGQERQRYLKRQSPTMSPLRSPQGSFTDCRVKKQEGGSDCLIHKGKDFAASHAPLKRAGKKKPHQKIEASLSAEDQSIIRELHKAQIHEAVTSTFRSASFSPTRVFSSSNSSSRNNSFNSSPTLKSQSPLTVQDAENLKKAEEQQEQEPKEEGTLESGEQEQA